MLDFKTNFKFVNLIYFNILRLSFDKVGILELICKLQSFIE